jgi:hypothetical protein
MWTGGKPPPAPAAQADTPSKSYRSDKQQSELDQLRQRGLAKLLNKHFTNVTQNLAEERAAADAALRDLEARKAAGFKDFSDVNPADGELSVWDKMYLELQQKKAQCKRKERETLLLYQRYVDKFGGTGVVAVPRSPAIVPDATAGGQPYHPGLGGTPSKVSHLAGQIESSLANSSNGEALLHSNSKWKAMTKSQQDAFAAMDQQERAAFLKSLEGQGFDANSPPLQPRKLSGKDGIPESPQLASDFPKWEENTPTKSAMTGTTVGTDVSKGIDPPDIYEMEDLDEDIRSIVSGLTSGDFSDAERALVDFLRTETDAIRKLLEDEEHADVMSLNTSFSNEMHSQSARAADDAEDLVRKMESLLRDFQNDEQSAAEAAASYEPRKLETTNPDEEWMIYWDDMAQRHYYYELKSNRAQWAKPSSATGANKGRDAVPMSDFTQSSSDRSLPLTFDEVMPLDDVPRQSRRDQYRKMRRRRRNRRALFLVFLMTSVVGAGLYVNRYHHEETKSNLARALGSEEQAELVIDTIEAHLPDAITGRSERNEKRIREESIRKAKQAAKEEKARLERLAAEEKARAAQQVVLHTPKKTFMSWACQNPHFFFVSKRRGIC